jgi:hypothetical protein
MHRVLYGAGFNPTELDRGLAISEELYATKQKMQAQVKQLGDAWSDAEMKGDSRQMGMILRQSVVWGVDVSSVIHSGMRNLQKMRKDLVERQMSPKLLLGYRNPEKSQALARKQAKNKPAPVA